MIPLTVETIQNIRDLGLTEANGKKIKPCCLIRSAHLAEASTQDLYRLKSTERLDTIIDLRTNQERFQKPDIVDGITYLSIPIFESMKAGISHESEQLTERFPDMAKLYRRMMMDKECQSGFYRVLRVVFDHDYNNGAVLWHCTEGKDRCGMVTALVLMALGVDKQIIMEDYLETNRVNLPKAQKIYEQLKSVRGEEFAQSVYEAYIVDERYLKAAWDEMGENYLVSILGFAETDIQSFRDKLLI